MLIEFLEVYPDAVGPTKSQALLRMSPEHAWVMVKVLDRLLLNRIKEHGPIRIPAALIEELGLEEEYENDMGGQDG